MLFQSVYRVKKGDTLESIARRFGFRSWKIIYNSAGNDGLRRNRPNPKTIKEGDVVNIPADVVKVARQRVEKLQALRSETEKMYDKYLQDWDRESRQMNSYSEKIDNIAKAATMVAGVFKELTSITVDGVKAMKLVGEELAKKNKELTRSVIKFGYSPLKDVAEDKALEVSQHQIASQGMLDLDPNDGPVSGVSKLVIKYLIFDCTNPSFWAGVITGTDIGEINRKTRAHIIESRDKSIAFLDKKIADARYVLMKQSIIVNSMSLY